VLIDVITLTSLTATGFTYYKGCGTVSKMDFIEDAIKSLHASWYAMVLFTVLPMIVSISRQLSLIYLITYAISSACVIMYGIPESPRRSASQLASEFDEKTHIFRAIKLQQDP
jgi:hypothetical protein